MDAFAQKMISRHKMHGLLSDADELDWWKRHDFHIGKKRVRHASSYSNPLLLLKE